MCGKGMSPTSSQTAAPNPAAMQAYMMGLGQLTAATSKPFQQYSSDPTAYVSPLTQTQTGAIQNISGMAGMTDPYYQAATGLTAAGAAPVGRLTGEQIGEYMSPYMSQVVDPVKAGLEQQFGQQLSQQQAQAIKSGAFGGSRADVARALLQGQQGLAMGQALSPLYQTGYGQALQTAQGQQAIEAANQQRMLAAGQQFGGLGSAAQQAALQQAQAQLQGGTLEQQTRNAMLQALYGEAQKARMYPLQAAQIQAQGLAALGPLMGTTQTTSQQLPFFGGLASGGAVDSYGEGLGRARMGGAVTEEGDYARGGYAYGGYPDDLSGLVEQQRAALGLGMPKEDIQVPIMQITPSKPLEPGPAPERQKGVVEQGLGAAMRDPMGTYEGGKKAYEGLRDYFGKSEPSYVVGGAGGLSVPTFADGGDVEDDAMQKMASAPIQASKPLTPQSSDQKDEGKGILGTLLKTGASMAANYFAPGSGALVSSGLGALGLAHGGRAGYEDGGDIYEKGILGAESGRRQFDREGRVLTSPKGALGIAQILESTAPEAAKLAGVAYDPERLRSDEKYNALLGRAYYNEQLRRFGTPQLAAAAYNAGPGRVQQALRRAEATGRDVMSFLPAETRDYVPRVMRMGGMGGEGGIGAARPLAFAGPEGKPASAALDAINAKFPAGGLGAARAEDTRGLGAADTARKTTEPTKTPYEDAGFLERAEKHPEGVILPILKGLGAMAGSRSKYLGSAVLEGLGAGAGSYMDTQKALAEIPKTEAEAEERRQLALRAAAETGTERARMGQVSATTAQILSGIPKNALIVNEATGQVLGVSVFRPGETSPTTISVGEYYSALTDPSKTPYQLAPRLGETGMVSPPPPAQVSGTKPPAQQTVQKPAATEEASKAEAGAPLYEAIPSNIQSMINKNAESVRRTGFKAMAQMPAANPFDAQEMAARQAQSGIQQRNALTKALNELSRSGRLVTSGQFSTSIATPIVGFVKSALDSLGAKDLAKQIADPSDLGSVDVQKKINTLLAAKRSEAGGQHSYAGLEAFMAANPSQINTPEGAANLLADIYVAEQREIDLDRFYKRVQRHAMDNLGLSAAEANVIGQGLRDEFTKTMEPQYAKDKKAISEMFLYGNQEARDPDTKAIKRVPMLSHIIESGGKINKSDEEKINKIHGTQNLIRYFSGG